MAPLRDGFREKTYSYKERSHHHEKGTTSWRKREAQIGNP
jgi:hypothetical protein